MEMLVLELRRRNSNPLQPVMMIWLDITFIDDLHLQLLLLLKQIVLSPVHILLNYILPQITLLQLSILV